MSGGAERQLAGLDGLRAVAVLLVLGFHQFVLPFGWIGVQIFFVLSGYLITRSLAHTRGDGLRRYLLNFYGRRSLRVFPLYFTVVALLGLAVAAGMNSPGAQAGLPWAATYTYNLWHASNIFVQSKLMTHFWSLCVEEQFYLFWPFVIYFAPARHLRSVLLGFVLAGPLLRYVSALVLGLPGVPANEDTHVAVYVLTTSHLDAFAIGGFTALFPFGGRGKPVLAALLVALLAAGLAVVALAGPAPGGEAQATWASLGYPLGLASGYAYVWGYSLLNVTSAVLIDCLVNKKVFPLVFDSAPMRHLGKVSYGFYLFHYPLQSILEKVLPVSHGLAIVVQVLLTTLIATLSFYLWESRFLALKERYFASRRASAAAAAPEASVAAS